VPPDLPDSIYVTAYAPFSQLLPLAAAMVHHGGIGTLSQCLAAGVPQLVVFMSLDQPDNAARIERLGVGLSLSSENLTEKRLLPLIKRCLEDPKIQAKAAHHAKQLQLRQAPTAMLDWLERNAG
jgi:rhamnosyltransferase subunit B